MLTADTITVAAIRALADEADFSPTFRGDRRRVLHLCAAAENVHGIASRAYQASCRARCAEILNQRAAQEGQMNFLDTRLPSRFWDKVVPEPMSGCWLWTGAANATDYARAKEAK